MNKIKEAFEQYKATGEVQILSDGKWDVEQLPTGDADYSQHSTALLKTLLAPGALHADERSFRKLIRAELKRRTKGKNKK